MALAGIQRLEEKQFLDAASAAVCSVGVAAVRSAVARVELAVARKHPSRTNKRQ